MPETEGLPTEPMEPEPTAPEPTEPEPEPTAPTEPTEPTAPDGNASIEAQSREQDETYNKLGVKAKNYVKGVGDILEETPLPLTVCEMCADAFPGVRWLEPSDETHAQLLAVVSGGMPLDLLEVDPDAEQCPVCQGKGGVKLPSKVPGNEARTCKRCNGAGFLERHPESGTAVAPATSPENGPAEPLPGVPLDDPAVVDLRSRGFTVIPPMQPVAAAQ